MQYLVGCLPVFRSHHARSASGWRRGAPPTSGRPRPRRSRLLVEPERLEGGRQVRVLLDAHDPHYSDLVAMTDPFPENAGEKRGALVEARVGRGTWTYVGLGLFRELPAGVPGAYRLLANLVSRPRG